MKESPIRYLLQFIPSNFERINSKMKDILSEDYKSGKIKNIINYRTTDRFETPFFDCKNKQINISELFCSYLWTICYFVYVINEEINKDKVSKIPFNGFLDLNDSVKSNALKLFEWGLSLHDKSSEWPDELPYPNKSAVADEGRYIKETNGIFVTTIVFILYHEYAHAVLGHVKDGLHSPVIEVEADNYAREIFLSPNENTNIELKSLALTISFLSTLFLQEKSVFLGPITTHPYADDRIKSSLSWIENYLPSDKIQYVYELSCNALYLYFQINDIHVELPIEYNDAKIMFYKMLNIVDENRMI